MNPTRQRDYRIVASPLVRDGVIYAPTRVRPLLALRPGGRGDVLDTHVIWSTDDGPDVPTPVTDGEYFYVVNDRGIVYVTDAKTGEPVYGPERIRRGTYSASPVLADGRIYVTNESGMTTVLRAGPEFEVLAENDFDDYVLSSPAVSEGQIFIRTTGFLYAIGERREEAVTTAQVAAGGTAAAEESAEQAAAGDRAPAGEGGEAPLPPELQTWRGLIVASVAVVLAALVVGGWRWNARRR